MILDASVVVVEVMVRARGAKVIDNIRISYKWPNMKRTLNKNYGKKKTWRRALTGLKKHLDAIFSWSPGDKIDYIKKRNHYRKKKQEAKYPLTFTGGYL